MKRSIFKLGKKFVVDSTTNDSYFRVEEDIDRWMQQIDGEQGSGWHFQFAQVEEGINTKPLEVGTLVEITDLHLSIKESFSDENFLNRLADEISVAHSMSMDYGLAISLNGNVLSHEPQLLLRSDILQPAFVEHTYPRLLIDQQDGAPIQVRLFAGVSERSLHDGGWYVFCNGRLVLRADQGSNTVWGRIHSMQQYHPDFSYFRGYAYYDSEDASLLPWTTTKTGVDTDSRVYKLSQQQMVEVTKPVLQFLANLEKERVASKEGDILGTPLKDAVESALPVRILSIEEPLRWMAPAPLALPSSARLQKIQYSKPADQVERVKKRLNVTTFTQVGEATFEYYLQYEGDE